MEIELFLDRFIMDEDKTAAEIEKETQIQAGNNQAQEAIQKGPEHLDDNDGVAENAATTPIFSTEEVHM